jgi:carboxypeptidase PM20D1
MRRILAVVGSFVLAAVGVVAIRAALLKPKPLTPVAQADAITIDEPGAVQRLASAIRVPTVSDASLRIDSAAVARLRDLMQASFPRVHAAMTREVMPSGSVVYTWKGVNPSEDPVILMGHLDVVPAESSTLSRWQHAPFSGDVADGSVWGRGTLDDKEAVFSMMEAAETLLAQGYTPARTLIFAFGDDEENGGSQGAANIVKLLQSHDVHAHFVVDEGGAIVTGIIPGLESPLAVIGTAEKGYLSLRLSTKAAGGHSSEPPPHTAIGQLAAGLTRLEAHPFPGSIPAPTRDMLMTVGPCLPFAKRLALANLWLMKGLVVGAGLKVEKQAGAYHTTTAVDMVEGGVKDNVLPTEARAVVNFRILPGESIDSVTDGVRTRIADSGIGIENASAGFARNPSPISPTDTDGYAALTTTIRQYYPNALSSPYLVQAATDSSYYYALSPNVYRFSPIEADGATLTMIHGFNEHITTSNYIHMVQFEAQLIRNIR